MMKERDDIMKKSGRKTYKQLFSLALSMFLTLTVINVNALAESDQPDGTIESTEQIVETVDESAVTDDSLEVQVIQEEDVQNKSEEVNIVDNTDESVTVDEHLSNVENSESLNIEDSAISTDDLLNFEDDNEITENEILTTSLVDTQNADPIYVPYISFSVTVDKNVFYAGEEQGITLDEADVSKMNDARFTVYFATGFPIPTTGTYTFNASLHSADGNEIQVGEPQTANAENLETGFSFTVDSSLLTFENTEMYYVNYSIVDENGKIILSNEGKDNPNTQIVKYVEPIYENSKVIVSLGWIDEEESKYVAGAQLQLINAAGNVVSSWVSANSARLMELDSGDYTLIETSVPTGYIQPEPHKSQIFSVGTKSAEVPKQYDAKSVQEDRNGLLELLINVTPVDDKNSSYIAYCLDHDKEAPNGFGTEGNHSNRKLVYTRTEMSEDLVENITNKLSKTRNQLEQELLRLYLIGYPINEQKVNLDDNQQQLIDDREFQVLTQWAIWERGGDTEFSIENIQHYLTENELIVYKRLLDSNYPVPGDMTIDILMPSNRNFQWLLATREKTGVTNVELGGIKTKTDINVSKEWKVDSNHPPVEHPSSATVELLKNNVSTGMTLELNQTNNWTGSFTQMPTHTDGNENLYTVRELNVPDHYTVSYGKKDDGTLLVTNTYETAKTNVSVNKIWDDNNDNDAKRPAAITVQLTKRTDSNQEYVTFGDEIILPQNGQWSVTIPDLPKYENQKEIQYSVQEISNIEGYKLSNTEEVKNEDTGTWNVTLTNSLEAETTSLKVIKVWDDNNDQDGIRPDSITVKLYADGIELIDHRELVTAEDGWNFEFLNLPKYKAGKEIKYSIQEEPVNGYSLETDKNNPYHLINRHTPSTVNFTVIKKWEDANDQDGKRPEKITVVLKKNDKATGETLELSESNHWEGGFSGLDEYTAGVKNTWSVEEVDIPGYTSEITGNQDEGFVITNKHLIEKTSISVRKEWDDINNGYGMRTDSVQIVLTKNGMDTSARVRLSSNNNWYHEFSDLDKYENGKLINWGVRENAVPYGYSASVSSKGNAYTVTNKYVGVENPVPSETPEVKDPEDIYAEEDKEFCMAYPEGCYYDETTGKIRRALTPNTSDPINLTLYLGIFIASLLAMIGSLFVQIQYKK